MVDPATLLSLGLLSIIVFASSLGVPGGMVAMISAGAFADTTSDLALVIGVAWLVAAIGDILAYELARRFSMPVSRGLARSVFFRHNEKRARDLLGRFEFWLVFSTRFAFTTLCAPVSYISGLERLDRRRFITAVVSGEFLYAAIYPTLGFLFKETWNDVYGLVTDVLVVVGLLIVTVVLVKLIRKARRHIAARKRALRRHQK